MSFIDNAVATTSGTIKVKAELPNPGQQLWPGQYVTARLTLRTLKDAAVVPQAAIILRGQERVLYVSGTLSGPMPNICAWSGMRSRMGRSARWMANGAFSAARTGTTAPTWSRWPWVARR